eukprot:50835-Eustigmatos_ZCMA.PRE.1
MYRMEKKYRLMESKHKSTLRDACAYNDVCICITRWFRRCATRTHRELCDVALAGDGDLM